MEILLIWFSGLAFAQPAPSTQIPDAKDACVGNKTETTPSSEFNLIENGSGVKHTRTTLDWQRCAVGQTWNQRTNLCAGHPTSLTWEKANKLAAKLTDNWRLPSVFELRSIVEACHQAPGINPQVFPNTQSGLFWSASLDTGSLDRIWCISFFTGGRFRVGKQQNAFVRWVRGVMQATPVAAPAQSP